MKSKTLVLLLALSLFNISANPAASLAGTTFRLLDPAKHRAMLAGVVVLACVAIDRFVLFPYRRQRAQKINGPFSTDVINVLYLQGSGTLCFPGVMIMKDDKDKMTIDYKGKSATMPTKNILYYLTNCLTNSIPGDIGVESFLIKNEKTITKSDVQWYKDLFSHLTRIVDGQLPWKEDESGKHYLKNDPKPYLRAGLYKIGSGAIGVQLAYYAYYAGKITFALSRAMINFLSIFSTAH